MSFFFGWKMMDLMDENQSSVRQFTGYGRIEFFTCFEFPLKHWPRTFPYKKKFKKKKRKGHRNWKPVDFCSSSVAGVFNFHQKSMNRKESRDLFRLSVGGWTGQFWIDRNQNRNWISREIMAVAKVRKIGKCGRFPRIKDPEEVKKRPRKKKNKRI